MSNRFFIRTPAKSEIPGWATLLSILEEIMPVTFIPSEPDQLEIAGRILVEDEGDFPEDDTLGVSSLAVPQCEKTLRKCESDESIDFAVRFEDRKEIPFPFRNRSLRTKLTVQPTILSLSSDERPLATCDEGPVWTVSNRETVKHFRSGFALPVLPAGGSLQDVLSGRRFLEMIPLLHWLREILPGAYSIDSPLKACFIFDDPNLHWPCYGYVDFRQLATQAEKENYHVAFATIPLDTWFTHEGTAGVFRKHRDRLSLLIHGNNHAKRELARPYTEPARIHLLRQAIRRVERLERRSGLSVSRVMVPPHGACSEEMLASLSVCGFEAACISHSSLRAHNKAKAWTRSLGYLPFERVRDCPVIPRWGVSGDLTNNTILLAAYLKQAIILRGHHQDLKNGPGLLDDLARFVNSLGLVKWLNMADIVRLQVSGVSAEEWRTTEGVNGSILKPPFGKIVDGGKKADATSKVVPTEENTLIKPNASVWFLRRLLTEGRDRLLSVGRKPNFKS